ncbi:hypothetical protein [Cellulosimicrobium aquatile]|uniref:hypothetical protein n=1 Tax=Cellulosimicrobium aquatile TaxID=1612203 RepID=UPI0014592F93|nr:hypothetical protein [Cellulosimicrobium aquatile]NMF29607.1 hypothetical protein [Cellulosimicrobium aquatile]
MTPDTCADHEWTTTTAFEDAGTHTFACTSCAATTTGCRDCARPLDGTALAICDRCLTRARQLLEDIGMYLAEMADVAKVAVGLRAVRYDLTGTPSTANTARLPHGLDAAYREDVPVAGPGSIRTRGGALDLLEAWVDDWAERCGDADGAHDTLAYLRTHTLWAAQNHPAWPTYLDELRATRAVVRRLAGLAPEREPVPCVHCGGTIVRDWTTWEGLSDVARCTGCGTTWGSRAHLALTERWHVHALPAERPDALVTAEQARAIWPQLKRNTLNQWISRHLLEPVDRDEHGRPRFILAAVAERVGASVA